MKTVYMPDGYHAFGVIEHESGEIQPQVFEGPNERWNKGFLTLAAMCWHPDIGPEKFLDMAAEALKSLGADPEELVAAYLQHIESLQDPVDEESA